MSTIHAVIKGYLIDPQAKTITQVSFPAVGSNLDHMYRLIGCGTVDVARMAGDTDCWIDDEGLFKPDDEQHFFLLDLGDESGHDWRSYVGKGLVLGCAECETVSARIDGAELCKRVRFYDPRGESLEAIRATLVRPQRIEEGVPG